jgi:hypothetical protein
VPATSESANGTCSRCRSLTRFCRLSDCDTKTSLTVPATCIDRNRRDTRNAGEVLCLARFAPPQRSIRWPLTKNLITLCDWPVTLEQA